DRLRPGHAFVIGTSEYDSMIACGFIDALRPHRHQRTIRAIEHQKMLVACVVGRAIDAARYIDNVIWLSAMYFMHQINWHSTNPMVNGLWRTTAFYMRLTRQRIPFRLSPALLLRTQFIQQHRAGFGVLYKLAFLEELNQHVDIAQAGFARALGDTSQFLCRCAIL